MSRATFLRGALGAGAAALVGSGSALPVGGTARAQLPVGTEAAALNWDGLRGQLRGALQLPWDTEYVPAKLLRDTRFDDAVPAAVVQVATTEDVQAAIRYATEHGLVVTARSGGHSYVGASATNGALVLDLRRLNEVHYDADRATIGAGALLSAVQDGLAPFGRTLPLGTCPSVGIAGLALGGGLGVESRSHGLTCDRMVSARMVLPDGTLVETSATDRPDLFWALRGGGGQLGVVTSLTFSTIPVTAKDIVRLSFPGSSAAQVLHGWAQWLHSADRAAWANIELSADGGGAVGCRALLVANAGTGESAAAALVDAIGVPPVTSRQQTLDHLAAARDLAGGSDDPPRTTFAAGSDVLKELSAESAAAIVGIVAARSRAGGRGGALIDPLDGAVRDLPGDATAFPWRAHDAVVQWIANTPENHGEAADWINRAHADLGPGSVGGYVNYLEPPGSGARYFAGNLNRLRDIRISVDPKNRIYSVPAM